MEKGNESFRDIVERIAVKYAKKVESRIDNSTEALSGAELSEIYEGVHLLGNLAATLERFRRTEDWTDSCTPNLAEDI